MSLTLFRSRASHSYLGLLCLFAVMMAGTALRSSAQLVVDPVVTWSQLAELKTPSGRGFYSVSVGDNGVAVAGAPDQSAAYVFTESGETWTLQAILVAADGFVQGDRFGYSVCLNGDTIAVGAPGKDAVYVFRDIGGRWTQQAKLAPTSAGVEFGSSVSLSGNSLLVGDIGDNSYWGAAYVFVENGGAWTQQAKFTPVRPYSRYFGWSVSLSGNTAVVGSPEVVGIVYVFTESDGTWTQQAELFGGGDIQPEEWFGKSVSLSGNTLLVGAPHHPGSQSSNTLEGSAYVFVQNGGNWIQQAELAASDPAYDDEFGYSVSLSGNTALVGARFKTLDSGSQGAVYVFVENGGSWTQHEELASADHAWQECFGYSVSLDGPTALIGAPGLAAYVFRSSSPTLTNTSFEVGSSSPMSFNGVGGGGPSAATGWSIWNNYSGTTMTELCTAASCPSGSVPPTPADGAHTLHVTTTSASSGVYQTFPSTTLFGASLWLKVVSGTVLVELLGPGGARAEITTMNTGVLTLPANGVFNEIVIYSLTAGVTEFYVDDIVLSTTVPANAPELTQISPTSGPVGTVVTLTGTGFGMAQQSSMVTFNGIPATPSAWSDTSIQVRVPVGATTGNVVVAAPGALSNGINFTVAPAANLDFESGSASEVSFTGKAGGGGSAAANWSIWNINPGTTTTELCTTTSCPSGSVPPVPAGGTHVLHVTTTSAYSGVYQMFPQIPLVGARLWLKVVSGAVTVTLFGPDGNIAKGATGTGYVTLPANGNPFREITIYSEATGAEFYVDAVDLTPPPVTNPSFEQGAKTPVSVTGAGNMGQSAATGWYIVNGASGSTMTELCETGTACPSGTSGNPSAVAGVYALHVTTTSEASGVYQTFRDTSLLSAALWLHVVSGDVTVTLFGPSGPLMKTVSSSGGVLLPTNGGLFNEILIASSGGGAEFYVDAVTLTPSLGTLTNPSFEEGSATEVSFTGRLAGGPSAATGWSMWNNNSGITTTELCSATSCPSGSVPPAPMAGTKILHVTTTCASCGVYQVFPQTVLETISSWLHVVSGKMEIQLLGPSPAVTGTTSTGGISFLPVNAGNPSGNRPYNEMALYSYSGAAEFYVDAVGVAP